jgi:valyl-tRNA synthetase
METGHDILFFWVARMMMLGLHLTDVEPFHTVFLSGLIRDERGQRMSKTKGNVVDPLEVMDETGADALRFAVIHGATPGQDQRFGQQRLETGRNFANKLWNATRFVLGARPDSIPAGSSRRAPDPAALGPAERWIRSRAAATVAEVDRAVAEYQLAEVTRALYDGIWSELCDWGLELAKVRLADGSLGRAEREATWWTLVEALDTYLRLLHPVMPYVTEELWSVLPHADDDPDLLMVARWPDAGAMAAVRDQAVEDEIGQIVELLTSVRNARATAGVAASAWLPLTVAVPPSLSETFRGLAPAIARLARARPLTPVADARQLGEAAGALTVVAGGLEARIDTATGVSGTADPSSERTRLERELTQAKAALAAARARLADPAFVERAPAHVVDGARTRAAELAERVARLSASLR